MAETEVMIVLAQMARILRDAGRSRSITGEEHIYIPVAQAVKMLAFLEQVLLESA